jgi:hypothetical protein
MGVFMRKMELTGNGNFRLFVANRKLKFGSFRFKRKPRHFSLIRLLFAHRAFGSLSFVRLFTKKQTEFIYLQTD